MTRIFTNKKRAIAKQFISALVATIFAEQTIHFFSFFPLCLSGNKIFAKQMGSYLRQEGFSHKGTKAQRLFLRNRG